MCQVWKKDDPWLSYELNAWATIDSVQIFNREGYEERMGHFQVWVGDAAGAVDAASGATLCHDGVAAADAQIVSVGCDGGGIVGRFVTILLPGDERILNFHEVYIRRAPTLRRRPYAGAAGAAVGEHPRVRRVWTRPARRVLPETGGCAMVSLSPLRWRRRRVRRADCRRLQFDGELRHSRRDTTVSPSTRRGRRHHPRRHRRLRLRRRRR